MREIPVLQYQNIGDYIENMMEAGLIYTLRNYQDCFYLI